MKKTPRLLAVEILNRVDEDDAFAEPLLDACLSGNLLTDPRDRGLLTQLVYGPLRMRGRLDWIIARLYRGKAGTLETGVRNILRTGLYQLLYTDRIPAFAVVDEAVKTAKKLYPGRAGLINAILRNALRREEELPYPSPAEDPALAVSTRHSHPLWLVRRWIEISGRQETVARCAANNEIPPLVLRANSLKATRDEVMAAMRADGFSVAPTVFAPEGIVLDHPAVSIRQTACWRKGWIQVQDEASQLIGRLVDPQPGETILDLCAGAGMKSAHLAALMGNRGGILARDANENKITALGELTRRLGATIIEGTVGNAAGHLEREFRERFDRVLVDAPCSGLGTLRRNPEIKWRLQPEDIRNCAALQTRILTNAAACLRKGGTLVYSTCTVMPEENEDIIRHFLGEREDFRCGPPAGMDGRLTDGMGFFRTSPHLHGTDGFFGAVLVKTG